MPTMDDVIGNLGEPLDFETESDENERRYPRNGRIIDGDSEASVAVGLQGPLRVSDTGGSGSA